MLFGRLRVKDHNQRRQTFISSVSSKRYLLVLRVCFLSVMWGDRSQLVVEMCWTNKSTLSCLQAASPKWNAVSQQISPSLPCCKWLRLFPLGLSSHWASAFFFLFSLTTKSVCAPSHLKSNKLQKGGNFLNGLGLLWHLLRFKAGPATSCRSAESPGHNCCFYCETDLCLICVNLLRLAVKN